MYLREGWIFVIGILCLLIGFILGAAIIHDAYMDDCKQVGIVTFDHIAYKCSAEGKSERQP